MTPCFSISSSQRTLKNAKTKHCKIVIFETLYRLGIDWFGQLFSRIEGCINQNSLIADSGCTFKTYLNNPPHSTVRLPTYIEAILLYHHT